MGLCTEKGERQAAYKLGLTQWGGGEGFYPDRAREAGRVTGTWHTPMVNPSGSPSLGHTVTACRLNQNASLS